ncbi:Activator of Hsp90 ATPase N-terminal [Carpediemonas membranifera]|uniref:Activator of Hsp90 ATPase N-terminal n=1 Tax=Carpediemonas membranifera TaxID=201153 RepID=A0A8J6AXR7_9EUKA|nr:Activator of Hsp90 ATPase N-terminal [Carpediemonas membranifera]|eukprot:KAG9395090.1 Activator of Hsp90 ATPase N-terminal [Carpediemonas membranifera]
MSTWNVNQWHWEEKKWSSWACDRLKEMFSGLEFESGDLKMTSVCKTVSGDAYVNIRKGKRYEGYDMKIEIDLEGEDADGKVSAKIAIPDFCDDVDDQAFKVNVTVTSPSGSGCYDKVTAAVDTKKIGEMLVAFIDELREK